MDWSDGVDVYANATAMHVGRFFGSTALLPMEVDSLGLFKASQLIVVFLCFSQAVAPKHSKSTANNLCRRERSRTCALTKLGRLRILLLMVQKSC